VLVDTQADVPAGGTNTSITLTTGTGDFGGADLAVEYGNSITIDTGVAQFIIKKANFNLFDSVIVNSKQFIRDIGSLVVLSNGIYYKSINDKSSTAIIEENGPVKAVVKADGQFKNQAGEGRMHYTMRMYFFRGKSYVKIDIYLRNASISPFAHLDFDSIEIKVPLEIGINKNFEFARKTDTLTRSLSASDTAYMYQAFSTKGLVNDWNSQSWNPPIKRDSDPYSFEQKGLEIRNGDVILNNLGNQETKMSGQEVGVN
jgi:hypothetical protein